MESTLSIDTTLLHKHINVFHCITNIFLRKFRRIIWYADWLGVYARVTWTLLLEHNVTVSKLIPTICQFGGMYLSVTEDKGIWEWTPIQRLHPEGSPHYFHITWNIKVSRRSYNQLSQYVLMMINNRTRIICWEVCGRIKIPTSLNIITWRTTGWDSISTVGVFRPMAFLFKLHFSWLGTAHLLLFWGLSSSKDTYPRLHQHSNVKSYSVGCLLVGFWQEDMLWAPTYGNIFSISFLTRKETRPTIVIGSTCLLVCTRLSTKLRPMTMLARQTGIIPWPLSLMPQESV